MRRREMLLAAAALSAWPVGWGRAQAGKTGRVFVGFPPGGPGDVMIRWLADRMKPAWAENAIVENKPGAAGRLAYNATKSAEPDGLSLLATPGSLLYVLPHTFKVPPFDPIAELAPVAGMARLDFVIATGPKAPAKSLAEYIDMCRKDPALATYGTAGNGTPMHFAGHMLGRATGVKFVHVAYRGGMPAVTDALGGHVPSVISSINQPMIEAHRAGTMRILAVCGDKRSSFLPDVPSTEELGVKGVSAGDWTGLFAPAKTPAAECQRISGIVRTLVGSGEYRDRIAGLFMEPLYFTPAELAKRLSDDHTRWGVVVKQAGFSQD